MDAAQDARSKLHTFPRHRWKSATFAPPAADFNDNDWLSKHKTQSSFPTTTNLHHIPHHQHTIHPLPAIETKCCQYEKQQFVSLKSQCEVSPYSKSLCCPTTNRSVHHLTHSSQCLTTLTCANETSTVFTNGGDHIAVDTSFGVNSFDAKDGHQRCCCCSCRRVSAKSRLGCWKWSFHNGAAIAVAAMAVAQFLMLLGALRSALRVGCCSPKTVRSSAMVTGDVQRIFRSVLPMLLLFNMLPSLYAG